MTKITVEGAASAPSGDPTTQQIAELLMKTRPEDVTQADQALVAGIQPWLRDHAAIAEVTAKEPEPVHPDIARRLAKAQRKLEHHEETS